MPAWSTTPRVQALAERLRRNSEETRTNRTRALTPRHACGGPWHPEPHPKQQAFLWSSSKREVLFGGQGGGGKSAALIMAGLQYVDVPNYSALIIRQNYRHLYDSGGTQEKLEQFLAGTEAQWVASLDRWEFPSGASLSLGFVEYERQRFKFQSTEYQFVAFDELSQWATDRVYRYLFTRMRRPAAGEEICEPCPSCGMTLDQVPIRMRAASNPGGPGHTWLKKRFIEPHRAWKRGDAERPEAPFIQSALVDNPSLDPASYLESLSAASPIERAWMQYGDWDAVEGGTMFKGAWFPVSPASPPDGSKWAPLLGPRRDC
jgi:hypothetical protein